MQKVRYNFKEPAVTATQGPAKVVSIAKREKNNNIVPPDAETISKLNALAKEYPFCVHSKYKNNQLF